MMSTVAIELHELVELLAESRVTDPARWPEQARHGAAMVQRLEAIEDECRQQRGRWNWELLDAATQDEYDGLLADLGKLEDSLNPNARMYSLEELEAELDLPRAR